MADIFDIFKKIEKEKSDRANQSITHILVGLGNPGAKYENTRHNAGFMAIDHIAAKCGATINRSKFHALVGEATVGGKRVLLMKPQTFMNESGIAVSEAAAFYKVSASNIIVMSDDINLDVGRMRVRGSGSDGGQKGLRSIINMMSSDAFPRIRFGVGKKPHPDYDLADWVLGNFSAEDKKKLAACFDPAFEGFLKLLGGDVDAAMQICNKAQL